jgi:cell wall-associated NlpC family hydrolase
MQKPNDSVIRNIIKCAETTPYVHNGRELGVGFDCLGFIIYFYGELGISLPSDDGVSISPTWFVDDPNRFVHGLRSLRFPIIKKTELQPLDLVLFSVLNPAITHSGVLLSSSRFVHMSPKGGLVIGRFEHYWYRHCHGGFRIIP